jgi:hypothetical protein
MTVEVMRGAGMPDITPTCKVLLPQHRVIDDFAGADML